MVRARSSEMYWAIHNLIVRGVVRALRQAGFHPHRVSLPVSLIEKIPPLFVDALIVAEDRRYRRHNGVDLWGVGRAVVRRLAFGKIEGASTIEQQCIRTVTGNYERTFARKLREWTSAIDLNNQHDKDAIARMYLSVAYFGAHMNGLAQACGRLKIDRTSPTIVDAATVVACLKYPLPKDPSSELLRRHSARMAKIIESLRGENEL